MAQQVDQLVAELQGARQQVRQQQQELHVQKQLCAKQQAQQQVQLQLQRLQQQRVQEGEQQQLQPQQLRPCVCNATGVAAQGGSNPAGGSAGASPSPAEQQAATDVEWPAVWPALPAAQVDGPPAGKPAAAGHATRQALQPLPAVPPSAVVASAGRQPAGALTDGGGAPPPPSPGTLCINLADAISLRKFTGGITWEPKYCYASFKELFPSPPDRAALRARLLSDLASAAAAARGVPPERIDAAEPWWAALRGEPPRRDSEVLADPAYRRFADALLPLLRRYLVSLQTRGPAVPCPGELPGGASGGGDGGDGGDGGGSRGGGAPLSASDLPLPPCPPPAPGGGPAAVAAGGGGGHSGSALGSAMGRHPQPWDALSVIADVMEDPGLCTVPEWGGKASYGEFLLSRMLNPEFHTYHVQRPEEDALLFLSDILYQAHGVYSRQRWLNVAAMQHPFDFMAIADIIAAVAPDVVIETGTANGGSALMWASALELSGPEGSRVITVDREPPGSAAAFGAESDAAFEAGVQETVEAAGGVRSPVLRRQSRATDHVLWRKRVTFVQGDSAAPETVSRVRELVEDARRRLKGDGSTAVAAAAAAAAAATTATAVAAARDALVGDGGSSKGGTGGALAKSRGLLAGESHSSGGGGGGERKIDSINKAATAGDHIAPAGSGATAGQESRAGGAAAAPGGARPLRVLVLLDSHHAASHVRAEMDAYCPLASRGSYCVVQDTKLSRWTDADPGPAAAVRGWLAAHPEFRVDRSRELLFTQHPGGYLLRL